MSGSQRPRVVIVGAGFAGLRAARTLMAAPVDVLVLDRNNYHTFLPLLYQVAAAELEPEGIVYPVRGILRRCSNVSFGMADVRAIDLAAHVLDTGQRFVGYDFLVVAMGSTSHFCGVAGAGEHAFPLKTLEDGIALRNHILCCFERAVDEPDASRRRSLLTFAVVGGGATGVEFAGALAELIRGPIVHDYPTLNLDEARIVLVESSEHLLAGLPMRLGDYAAARLRGMGVEVRLRCAASEVTPTALSLQDGSLLATHTVVWMAGVQGDPRVSAWGLPTIRNGRVAVQPTLQVPDHPEVYVVGDLAYAEEAGAPLPMIAPVALQQGALAARNIARQLSGQPLLPFRYRDRGAMVTIGRNAAAVRMGGRAFTGFPAWALWLGVHIFHLIGFRNRLLVLTNWAWDYFVHERAVRLILPSKGG